MGRPFIVLGDRTDHGGVVVGSARASSTQGKGIARVGDMVTCPRCRGVFPISQGDNTMIVDGAPVAFHGCKVACGATLISSQVVSYTDPSSQAGAADGTHGAVDDLQGAGLASRGFAQGFGSIGGGLVARYEGAASAEPRQRFQGRFQVLDRDTGEPVAAQEVRLRSTTGQYLTGSTDAQGYTQWVVRDTAEHLALDLVEPGSDSGRAPGST